MTPIVCDKHEQSAEWMWRCEGLTCMEMVSHELAFSLSHYLLATWYTDESQQRIALDPNRLKHLFAVNTCVNLLMWGERTKWDNGIASRSPRNSVGRWKLHSHDANRRRTNTKTVRLFFVGWNSIKNVLYRCSSRLNITIGIKVINNWFEVCSYTCSMCIVVNAKESTTRIDIMRETLTHSLTRQLTSTSAQIIIFIIYYEGYTLLILLSSHEKGLCIWTIRVDAQNVSSIGWSAESMRLSLRHTLNSVEKRYRFIHRCLAPSISLSPSRLSHVQKLREKLR